MKYPFDLKSIFLLAFRITLFSANISARKNRQSNNDAVANPEKDIPNLMKTGDQTPTKSRSK